jgi:hypothetical protein
MDYNSNYEKVFTFTVGLMRILIYVYVNDTRTVPITSWLARSCLSLMQSHRQGFLYRICTQLCRAWRRRSVLLMNWRGCNLLMRSFCHWIQSHELLVSVFIACLSRRDICLRTLFTNAFNLVLLAQKRERRRYQTSHRYKSIIRIIIAYTLTHKGYRDE